jgi:hypothetical protein
MKLNHVRCLLWTLSLIAVAQAADSIRPVTFTDISAEAGLARALSRQQPSKQQFLLEEMAPGCSDSTTTVGWTSFW